MKMAWPRQLTLTTAPGSSLLMSCSTGAPSAWARALGLQEARNGTAVMAAPAMPVTVVATSRKWRRPPSTPSSLDFPTSDVIQISARHLSHAHLTPAPASPGQGFKRSRNSALYTHRLARHEAPPSVPLGTLTVPTVPQTLLFLLKWTVVGLAVAAVLMLARPIQQGPIARANPAQQDSPATPVTFTPR